MSRSTEETECGLAERRYLCNIVQLLAFCSRGENRTVESICQCILTVDELLDLACLPLCPGLRKAYLQYLHFVFLHSTSAAAATDLKNIARDQRLWQLLDRFTNVARTFGTL